jgi:D-alanyl-lipoteichoic acid acyltransferase DltB (MBOAT superfamily)
MLFNSPVFIFLFLPITLIVYFLLNRSSFTIASKQWLIAASLFFYAWWNILYLPLMLFSILINYFLALQIQSSQKTKKIYMLTGLFFNLSFLGYFKYMDFFITNVNAVLGTELPLLHLVLPLAISFYTIQQIAYLIDSYGRLVKERNFYDYVLFATFFPHLLAGPILHHKEMMPQFKTTENKKINYNNLSAGLFLFSIGLFKKVVIADTFSQWANAGFQHSATLNLLEAWATTLSYTFQLYFDFSGYTDMAIGVALMFNIKLPQNFNSPYRALNLIDFWSRWHMTLTRFLTTYVYEPIVRSFEKFSFHRAMFATIVTMLIAGLWHGAAWTFILFGFLHGSVMVLNHYWKKTKIKLPMLLAWFLTFNFLNLSFVIFRADNLETVKNIYIAMIGLNGIVIPEVFMFLHSIVGNTFIHVGQVYNHINGKAQTTLYLIIALFVVLRFPNANQLTKSFEPTLSNLFLSFIFLTISFSMFSKVSEFLYFNF